MTKNLHIAQVSQQFWDLAFDQTINLVAAIVILCVGWMIANAAARWTGTALARVRHFDATLKPLTASLVRYAIVMVTAIAVLDRFGIRTTSVIAMLGAAGIAVGLAIQGTLSNVASGVMLLLLRVFHVGDEITAGGYTGLVREIGLFRTVLITGDGLYMSVPNTTIFSGPIINNSREPTRVVSFKVMVDLLADVEKAQSAILEVLHADSRVLKNPSPGAPVAELGENYVALSVSAWCFTSTYGTLQPELQRLVRKRLMQERIRSPQRVVSLAGTTSSPQSSESAAESPRRRTA